MRSLWQRGEYTDIWSKEELWVAVAEEEATTPLEVVVAVVVVEDEEEVVFTTSENERDPLNTQHAQHRPVQATDR